MAAGGHGLQAVVDQVIEDLVQQAGIGQHRRAVGVYGVVQPDVALLYFQAEAVEQPAQHAVQFGDLQVGRHRLGPGQHVLHQPRQARTLRLYLANGLRHALVGRDARRQELYAQQDAVERAAHLVREGLRGLAHVSQLVQVLLPDGVGLHFRQVADRHHAAAHRQGPRAHNGRELLAAAPQQLALVRERGLGQLQRLAHQVREWVFGQQHIVEGQAGHVFRTIAQHARRGAIDFIQGPGAVEHQHAFFDLGIDGRHLSRQAHGQVVGAIVPGLAADQSRKLVDELRADGQLALRGGRGQAPRQIGHTNRADDSGRVPNGVRQQGAPAGGARGLVQVALGPLAGRPLQGSLEVVGLAGAEHGRQALVAAGAGRTGEQAQTRLLGRHLVERGQVGPGHGADHVDRLLQGRLVGLGQQGDETFQRAESLGLLGELALLR